MKPYRRVYVNTMRVVPRMCPVCRTALDGATSLVLDTPPAAPPIPQPGDITACATCGSLLLFTEDGFAVADEGVIASCDPAVQKILRGFQEFQAQYSRGSKH
jgi:hypothetical protein